MKERKLKLFNGRGHGQKYGRSGRFFIAAYSVRDAARVMVGFLHPTRPDDEFHINRMAREIHTYYSKGMWGNSMEGITPERGLWASADHCSKPVRVV